MNDHPRWSRLLFNNNDDTSSSLFSFYHSCALCDERVRENERTNVDESIKYDFCFPAFLFVLVYLLFYRLVNGEEASSITSLYQSYYDFLSLCLSPSFVNKANCVRVHHDQIFLLRVIYPRQCPHACLFDDRDPLYATAIDYGTLDMALRRIRTFEKVSMTSTTSTRITIRTDRLTRSSEREREALPSK